MENGGIEKSHFFNILSGENVGRFGLFGLLLLGLISTGFADERFLYRVSYRGLLSAMQELRIAEVRLAVGGVDGEGRHEARLSVTSKPFTLVESLYPFRLCAKTLFQVDIGGQARSLLYGLENQSRKELEELLLWWDWPHRTLHRYQHELQRVDAARQGAALERLSDMRALYAQLRNGGDPRLPSQGEYPLPAGAVLDRLSLFLGMRKLSWRPGEQRIFSVAVDDEILSYRLYFKAREKTRVFGREHASLRVEMTELDEAGKPGHVVTFWFSDDVRHLPLKGHSAHALGDFLMQLVEYDDRSVADLSCAAQGFGFMRSGEDEVSDVLP